MPGTGHSARYKGSISNRSKVSPFEQLAKWNQELLGADGMVPSITGGGGGLEFKKLNASDIDGVMTNPANLSIPSGGSLDMSCLDITQVRQLKFCRVSGGASFQSDELIISNNNVDGNIQIKDKPLKLRQLSAVGTTNQVDLILDSTSSTNNIELSIRGETTNDGKIFIGFEADPTAPFSATRNITIGHRASSHGGKQNINIGTVFTTFDTINIGNANTSSTCNTTILASGNLKLGNLNTSAAGLTSETTTVTGNNRLNLVSNAGGQIRMYANGVADIYIGSQAADKIGFRGAPPIPQNQMVIGTNLPNANVAYQQTQMQDVIDKVNAIRESLVRVGLCQQ